MAVVVGAVDRTGRGECVEDLPHGAVPERVEVELEARAVETGHGLGEQCGVDEAQPGVGGRAAAAVEVRLQQAGREVLGDAVLHDLDAGGVEAAHPAGAAALLQLGDLFQAAFAVPPQGADDAGPQRALAGGAQVDAVVVGVAGEGADHGVLPAGHAEGEQVLLRGEQARVRLVRRRDGHVAGHQVHGALLEGAGRGAVRLPLDASVRRVGRGAVDAREVECAGVDPGAVAVPVGEHDRPVRHDRVEHGAGGRAPGEEVHGPAAAADPGGLGVLLGVGGHHRQVAVDGALLAQVAAEHLDAGHRRMHVGVLESGDEQSSVEVDHLGVRVGEGAHRRVVGDGEDPSAPDGDGGADRRRSGPGEHLSAHEYGVGPLPSVGHRRILRLGGRTRSACC